MLPLNSQLDERAFSLVVFEQIFNGIEDVSQTLVTSIEVSRAPIYLHRAYSEIVFVDVPSSRNKVLQAFSHAYRLDRSRSALCSSNGPRRGAAISASSDDALRALPTVDLERGYGIRIPPAAERLPVF